MNAIIAVTGMLPAILLTAALLTGPISWLLLHLYRRAVIRSMNSGVAVAPDAAVCATVARDAPAISIVDLPAEVLCSAQATHWQQTGAATLRRNVIAYALGGLSYGLVMAIPWNVTVGFLPGRYLWITVSYAWPMIIVTAIIAAHSHVRYIVAGIYVALLALIAAWVLPRSPQASLWQLMTFWFMTNAAETLLLLLFLLRPIRAVGALVLMFMVAAVGGAMVTVQAAGVSDAWLRVLVNWGGMVGLGGTGVFVLLQIIGLVIFGLVGRVALAWFGLVTATAPRK